MVAPFWRVTQKLASGLHLFTAADYQGNPAKHRKRRIADTKIGRSVAERSGTTNTEITRHQG